MRVLLQASARQAHVNLSEGWTPQVVKHIRRTTDFARQHT